jgi:hypothetical protein
MNVEINGEKLTVPVCSCGKCIIKINRDGNRNSKYPYNRNMSTTYTNSFQKNGKGLSAQFVNRSIRNSFDTKHREYLTSGLMSRMKFDFKPYLVKLNNNQGDENEIENTPFLGRSTYGSNFPSWGEASKGNTPNGQLPFIDVPFRGGSNYSDNYKPHDLFKNSPCKRQKSTLGFSGKILNDSNVRESYKPIERPFSMEKNKKSDIEKTKIVPADYPKEFRSTYGNNFKGFNSECELAHYLKKSGMKNLEL